MRIAPQLALSVDIKELSRYIQDPRFEFEQKLDGHRLLIHIEDGTVQAANRRGELIPPPPSLAQAFGNVAGHWVFDGEWLDGVFWLFDLPVALNHVTLDTPRTDRRRALEAVYEVGWADHPNVNLVDVAKTSAEKRALVQWVRDNNGEGVVIKAKNARYRPGKRINEMLKIKFVETADCIITTVRREGKASCGIGLVDDKTGLLQEVGAIKMRETDLENTLPGDVVECRYLYMTKDQRLYGPPVFVRFRDDKSPEECVLSQCKLVNKTVRQVQKEGTF